MQKASKLALVLTLALLTLITLLTLRPATGISMGNGMDKLYHFVAFAGLMLPVAILRPQWLLVTALIMLGFGALIEVIQPYVGRGRELADWYADAGGVVAGSLVGLSLRRISAPLLRTS